MQRSTGDGRPAAVRVAVRTAVQVMGQARLKRTRPGQGPQPVNSRPGSGAAHRTVAAEVGDRSKGPHWVSRTARSAVDDSVAIEIRARRSVQPIQLAVEEEPLVGTDLIVELVLLSRA